MTRKTIFAQILQFPLSIFLWLDRHESPAPQNTNTVSFGGAFFIQGDQAQHRSYRNAPKIPDIIFQVNCRFEMSSNAIIVKLAIKIVLTVQNAATQQNLSRGFNWILFEKLASLKRTGNDSPNRHQRALRARNSDWAHNCPDQSSTQRALKTLNMRRP